MDERIEVAGLVTFPIHYRGAAAAVRTRFMVLAYLFFVLLPAATLIWIHNSGRQLTMRDWTIGCLGPFFVLILIPGLRVLGVWQARRGNASTSEPISWMLTPAGLESRGRGFEFKISWESVQRVIETRHFFLFYLSRNSAQFVPKVFARLGDVERMRELIRSRKGGRAKLRVS